MSQKHQGTVLKVLHVTEAYAGGVKTALDGYVKLSVDVEHHIIWSARRHAGEVVSPDAKDFQSVKALPASHFRAVQAVISAIRELKPDVVHAHSSFGGVYGRLAAKILGVPVVYTPHGLASERKDVSPMARKCYWLVEKLLSRLTTVNSGCSTHEARLLAELNLRTPNIMIPNALSRDGVKELPQWEKPNGTQKKVCFVGRIAAARHPELAGEIARSLTERGIECIWIGDGESTDREHLEASGVGVLGWMQRDDVFKTIAQCDVAVHTSRWDGFPMSVLEYIHIGIPCVVSDIPALAECPREARFSNPDEAVETILALIRGELHPDWTSVRETYSISSQRAGLLASYSEASNEKVSA